jgi:diguanylate cyclase (GGDEF)-like protein/PAS domain S-box-containing protein
VLTSTVHLPSGQTFDPDLEHRIVACLDQGIYFADRDLRIRYWSDGAERITGYRAGEAIGRRCPSNLLDHVNEKGVQLCVRQCPLMATLEDGKRRHAFVYLRHRDGHRVPVRIHTLPVRDADGSIVGVAETFTDEATPMPAQVDVDELRRLAFADAATSIPNRTHAERVLAGRLASLERRGWPFGLLVVDVDEFKTVNDLHGHVAGDEVLRVVARTMTAASRPEDFVARWAGDEFVVVVTATHPDELMAVARRIRVLVARSRPAFEASIAVTISVGGALARVGDTVESLFSRADTAIYAAKAAGRDRACICDGDGLRMSPPRRGSRPRRDATLNGLR